MRRPGADSRRARPGVARAGPGPAGGAGAGAGRGPPQPHRRRCPSPRRGSRPRTDPEEEEEREREAAAAAAAAGARGRRFRPGSEARRGRILGGRGRERVRLRRNRRRSGRRGRAGGRRSPRLFTLAQPRSLGEVRVGGVGGGHEPRGRAIPGKRRRGRRRRGRRRRRRHQRRVFFFSLGALAGVSRVLARGSSPGFFVARSFVARSFVARSFVAPRGFVPRFVAFRVVVAFRRKLGGEVHDGGAGQDVRDVLGEHGADDGVEDAPAPRVPSEPAISEGPPGAPQKHPGLPRPLEALVAAEDDHVQVLPPPHPGKLPRLPPRRAAAKAPARPPAPSEGPPTPPRGHAGCAHAGTRANGALASGPGRDA